MDGTHFGSGGLVGVDYDKDPGVYKPWKPLTMYNMKLQILKLPNMQYADPNGIDVLIKATNLQKHLRDNANKVPYSGQQFYTVGVSKERNEARPIQFNPDFSPEQMFIDSQDYRIKGWKSGWTLPFSPNTGPGNDPQVPTNTADEHSLKHDLRYEAEPENVKEIDDDFINEQLDHAIEDPIGSVSQITGLIGSAGIAAKRKIESLTGTLYPTNNSKFYSVLNIFINVSNLIYFIFRINE